MPSSERAILFLKALKMKACPVPETDVVSPGGEGMLEPSLPNRPSGNANLQLDSPQFHVQEDGQVSQAPNILREEEGSVNGAEASPTQLNGMNDIFGDIAMWDLGITGLNDFPWPTNWS